MFDQLNPVEQVTKQITEQTSSFNLEDLYNDFKQPSLTDAKTLASADPVSALALKGLDKLNINPVDSMLQGFSLDMPNLTKNTPLDALIPKDSKPQTGSDCAPQEGAKHSDASDDGEKGLFNKKTPAQRAIEKGDIAEERVDQWIKRGFGTQHAAAQGTRILEEAPKEQYQAAINKFNAEQARRGTYKSVQDEYIVRKARESGVELENTGFKFQAVMHLKKPTVLLNSGGNLLWPSGNPYIPPEEKK